MKRVRLIISIALLSVLAAGCGAPDGSRDDVRIIAHRGFWNCEEGGFSENSIASLKAAQDAGLWGSECDIQLTADDVVIVNHDGKIAGKRIRNHPYADFENDLLPNGERRPTFDEYLDQCEKCSSTVLVIEFKAQANSADEDLLLDKAFASIKAHDLFSPKRVAFISFSRYICERIAHEAPSFTNQYLGGDITPEDLHALGINGWDYHFMTVRIHPHWVEQAAALGMSTNVWTVNNESVAKVMINLGIDAITTNYPLMVRSLLSDDK